MKTTLNVRSSIKAGRLATNHSRAALKVRSSPSETPEVITSRT
jgi:hypothetical protein